jgi:hypothetical protein
MEFWLGMIPVIVFQLGMLSALGEILASMLEILHLVNSFLFCLGLPVQSIEPCITILLIILLMVCPLSAAG